MSTQPETPEDKTRASYVPEPWPEGLGWWGNLREIHRRVRASVARLRESEQAAKFRDVIVPKQVDYAAVGLDVLQSRAESIDPGLVKALLQSGRSEERLRAAFTEIVKEDDWDRWQW